MVENWLENFDNNCPDGYQVVDSPAFLMRAQNVIGNVVLWDRIRAGDDFTLTRDPHVGTPIYESDL